MNYLDLESWKRRDTFEFFKDFEDPFFNLTAPVDATPLYGFVKRHGLSFSIVSLFCSLQAANAIPEFRLRNVDGKVAEFETIDATQTILNDDETFSFCYFQNHSDVFEFERNGRESVKKYKTQKSFDVESERVDLIYYSVIPWISFTSFKHAGRLDNRQSVPRMVFGKLFEQNGRMMLPHSVEVHHALADGLHVGRYFESLQTRIDQLDEL